MAGDTKEQILETALELFAQNGYLGTSMNDIAQQFVQEQIEQSKAEESAESVVPGTVRAAAEQAENFLHGTRLTAGMVSAFIENVFVHDGGRIVVRFKYEQSIQDTVKALHTD